MISIVTPSFNQAAFLEVAIQSVLTQEPEVEYVVVDGGSTDGSVEVIERYADRLAAWRSEPDRGQYDAINKGFALTSGEIMGWLNADDFYFPGCLSLVQEIFETHPEIDWLTSTYASIATARGHVVRMRIVNRFSRRAYFRGYNLPSPGWHAGHFIPQESAFWRRTLWQKVGAHLDGSLAMAGDFELWARFYRHAELWGVRALMGAYRSHPAQKTSVAFAQYIAEGEEALRRHGGHRYEGLELRLRRKFGPRVTGSRAWRLPPLVRGLLLSAGLLHQSRELIWSDAERDWIVNTEYFV